MATSKQRRAAEQRRLRRQAERRQQQLARRRRTNIIMSVVGTLVLVAGVIALIVATNGSGSTPKPKSTTAGSTPASTPAGTAKATPTTSGSPSATPSKAAATKASTTAAAQAATTTCRYPSSGTAARRVSAPPTRAGVQGTATVRVTTSQGPMTFSLDRAAAPCAVNSFVSLVKQGYFTGTSCHRLVTKSIFLLQCGDPTGTGRGGPGYRFADELGTDPVFRRGSLVMANGGPNTNGSQFFVIDRDTRLGAAYTPLGTVSAGLAVADKVYRAGTSDGSTDGPPKLRLTFRSMRVA